MPKNKRKIDPIPKHFKDEKAAELWRAPAEVFFCLLLFSQCKIRRAQIIQLSCHTRMIVAIHDAINRQRLLAIANGLLGSSEVEIMLLVIKGNLFADGFARDSTKLARAT
jgi:hypothetical protein